MLDGCLASSDHCANKTSPRSDQRSRFRSSSASLGLGRLAVVLSCKSESSKTAGRITLRQISRPGKGIGMKSMQKRAFRGLSARGSILIGLIVIASTLAGAQNGSVWETKKSAWQLLNADQLKDVFKFAEDYKTYLRVARSALTSAGEVIRLARASGFQDFHDRSQVKPGARLIFNNRDRAVILALVGSDPLTAGSRVIGTHHD